MSYFFTPDQVFMWHSNANAANPRLSPNPVTFTVTSDDPGSRLVDAGVIQSESEIIGYQVSEVTKTSRFGDYQALEIKVLLSNGTEVDYSDAAGLHFPLTGQDTDLVVGAAYDPFQPDLAASIGFSMDPLNTGEQFDIGYVFDGTTLVSENQFDFDAVVAAPFTTGADLVIASENSGVLATKGGNDTIIGSEAADKVKSSAGNDIIFGNGGNDHIMAGKGRDTLSGGEGNDTLMGRDGKDRLIGGEGNDILVGGSRADTFVFAVGDGHDRIKDFGKNDFIEIEGLNYNDLTITKSGRNTVIDLGDDTSILLEGVRPRDISEDDFIFT